MNIFISDRIRGWGIEEASMFTRGDTVFLLWLALVTAGLSTACSPVPLQRPAQVGEAQVVCLAHPEYLADFGAAEEASPHFE